MELHNSLEYVLAAIDVQQSLQVLCRQTAFERDAKD